MAHHDSVSGRSFLEEFHIGRVVPRQFSTFTNRAISVNCDNSNDHISARLSRLPCGKALIDVASVKSSA
jgi:hypothetical protein